LTIAIYLAHLNPVTNAHLEIIEELRKEADVIVMPVVFMKNNLEVNSKSFPFNFSIRKEMLETIFGNSISISKNYTFHAPFSKYFPPLISPKSWKLRKKILDGISKNYFTYTGDKSEGYLLRLYNLNPRIGERKDLSAASVKNQLYEEVEGKITNWQENVAPEVRKIIIENWKVVEQFAKSEDRAVRVLGMKFPREGFWFK